MLKFQNYNFPSIARALRMMGKRYKLFLLCIFVFSATEIAGIPFYTYGIKGVMTAASDGNLALFYPSLGMILLCHGMWWVVAPISSYLCAVASKSGFRDIKAGLFGHVLRLPQSDLDTREKGELMAIFSNDVACLQRIYDRDLWNVFHSAMLGVGGMVMMTILDWRFALVVFGLGAASIFTTAYFSKRLEAAGKEVQERLAATSVNAYELIKAAKAIRVLKLVNLKTDEIERNTGLEADAKITSGRISAGMNASLLTLQSLSFLAIFGIGAVFVYFKLSDWGTLTALTALKICTDCLFLECGQFMADMQKSIAGVKRVFALCDAEEELTAQSDLLARRESASLQLKDVIFSYPGGAPVLEGFSLAAEQNSLTVLAGESGSGKSTIIKLILGLYSPESGKILIGGEEATSAAALRSMTAYVPQEPMLFHGSVFDNIACGKAGCGEAEVIAAAKQAQADLFISGMEKGYSSILEDDGKNLSGGQKQRIALARALVKNAPILLLDEITSSLDPATEEQILETIKNISKSKTVLLVTHNPGAVKFADHVTILEK